MEEAELQDIDCYKANYGTESGGGVASGGAGFEAVVGSGEPQCGGDTGGGAGGRGRKGPMEREVDDT